MALANICRRNRNEVDVQIQITTTGLFGIAADRLPDQ
jgi:hypothetical protein